MAVWLVFVKRATIKWRCQRRNKAALSNRRLGFWPRPAYFPRNYLVKLGFYKDRDRNQVANFTYIYSTTNIIISDNSPEDYVTEFRNRLGEDGYIEACMLHALSESLEIMEYMDFLYQRRRLMAQVVKKAFDHMCNGWLL